MAAFAWGTWREDHCQQNPSWSLRSWPFGSSPCSLRSCTCLAGSRREATYPLFGISPIVVIQRKAFCKHWRRRARQLCGGRSTCMKVKPWTGIGQCFCSLLAAAVICISISHLRAYNLYSYFSSVSSNLSDEVGRRRELAITKV